MSIYIHIILSLSVQIPLIFVMAFACGFDQNCMSLARLAPQPHLSVLDMQGSCHVRDSMYLRPHHAAA